MKILILLVLAVGFSGGEGERALPEDLGGDPHAIFLYGRMMGTLQGAKSMAFECTQVTTSTREGSEDYRSESAYKAWLMKPNYARLETSHPRVGATGILVGDGDHFWSYWPNGTRFFTSAYRFTQGKVEQKVYMKKASPLGRHSLAHEIGYLGSVGMSVLELSAFHGYTDSLNPYLERIESEGEESLGDEVFDVIRLSFMKGQRERLMWISRKDHLPRKLRSIVHVAYDIITEEVWTEVRLNEALDPALFAWTPPEGWEERKMPDPEDGLLQKGATAPAFALRDARGGRITFPEEPFKPVWLMFWRVG